MSTIYSFPQYRRLVNGKSYYQVESVDEMTEVGTLGRYWWEHRMEAKILPERLLIKDILNCEGGSWEPISPSDFESFLEEIKRSKEQRSI